MSWGSLWGLPFLFPSTPSRAPIEKADEPALQNLGADLVVQKPERRTMGSGQVPESMQGIRLPISNQLLTPKDLQKLASIEGVGAMASALLLWQFDQGGFRTLMGVDLSQPDLGPVKVKKWIKEGHFPQQEGGGGDREALREIPSYKTRRQDEDQEPRFYRGRSSGD